MVVLEGWVFSYERGTHVTPTQKVTPTAHAASLLATFGSVPSTFTIFFFFSSWPLDGETARAGYRGTVVDARQDVTRC